MQRTLFLNFDCYYHIYNRGTNKDTIFRVEKDYTRFLYLWEKYSYSILDTYAYCLIPNHFHFMVKVKKIEELKQIKCLKSLDDQIIKLFLSRQLSHLFNAYSKYFNAKYARVGKLFCERFKRKEMSDNKYFTTLINYIHTNPVKHGLVEDFRDYEYSSYWATLLDQPTRLKKEEVISWYGSKHDFELSHYNLRG